MQDMIDKLSHNICRQEKAIAEMEVPRDQVDTEVSVDDFRKYLTPDRSFAELFIRQITVYADRKIEVVWNFREEWLDI